MGRLLASRDMTVDDPKVQVNVRLPVTLRDEMDARRAPLGLSRDEWMRRALVWAMSQPPKHRSGAKVTAIARRTATPAQP